MCHGRVPRACAPRAGACACLSVVLTRGVALVDVGGDLRQRVSAGGGGRGERRGGALSGFLLLQVCRTNLLADAGLQQAVGGDGATPEQPVQTGLHREHHALETGGGALHVSR